MISAEAPILFAKACEMFIVEMTHKAYFYAAKNNRKTLQRNDISAAIVDTEIYDFLLDTIPNEHVPKEVKETKMVRNFSAAFIVFLLIGRMAYPFSLYRPLISEAF